MVADRQNTLYCLLVGRGGEVRKRRKEGARKGRGEERGAQGLIQDFVREGGSRRTWIHLLGGKHWLLVVELYPKPQGFIQTL